MREEIAAAVVFLRRLIEKCESLPSGKLEAFSDRLSDVLVERFRDHWYKEKPTRGQGYRCISFSPAEPIDPVLEKAASESGISLHEPVLPIEMMLWVDPNEVCCRIGDIRSNYCTVATMKDGSLDNKADTLDVADLIQRARELYNRQLNITTTRVNSNKSKPLDKLNCWYSPKLKRKYDSFKPSLQTDNHNFTFNNNLTERDFQQNENLNRFENQNNSKPFTSFNSRLPLGTLENGQPFIPPDFSIPPPPLSMKLWQAPGAYSPPAKNKNQNVNFRNKNLSSRTGTTNGSVNNDRFHWHKDGQKNVS